MKIVMLGHSSVGKTTYMASMYGELQTPVNGFGLRAERKSDHDDLIRMHRQIRRGRYPSPSDQRAEYDFVLTFEGEDFFGFTWMDYRGGALGEHRGSPQTKQLLDDLKEADGIMIFCDCETLARRSAGSNQIGRMTNLIGQTLQGFEHPIPLAIVLTKADLVDELTEEMLCPLRGLAESISASEKVSGTIIPVACGREPDNVQMPLLFILHFGILYLSAAMFEVLQEHLQRKEALEARAGWWDDLTSYFLSEPTYRDLAGAELMKAIEMAQKLEVLEEPAEALGSYLEELDTF